MVQTRAAARQLGESGQAHGHNVQRYTPLVQSSSRKKPPQATKRRRRRGPTGELCRLNLDVLFLLAAYVGPLDLLNLAHTCKSLRGLLMDKTSEFVWRTARRQVEGFPDCPPDLTEPAYANLAFYARCHGCGKHARTILWNIRRRYCPNCKLERLCPIDKCTKIIREHLPLPMEHLKIGNETTMWVDKEQMVSFMKEYNRCPDKYGLLSDKEDHCIAIGLHVRRCFEWERMLESERIRASDVRRGDRRIRIFERLKQNGFQPEIDYFGSYKIRTSNSSLFRTSRPLTDSEWSRVWPAWVTILNELRLKRLKETVYRHRRELLASEYCDYIMHPSPDAPFIDCLPHVSELARFPPFQDIIKAPEDAQLGEEPFESAIAQLPSLVAEWREKIASELAGLVQIPDHLSSRSKSKGKRRLVPSSDRGQSHSVAHKLRLASAVFITEVISTYPEVLQTMQPPIDPIQGDYDTLPIGERFQIKFLEEAPYIVHACGLDPNVATVEDMDNRNARLQCLRCGSSDAYSWRDALSHAHSYHDGFSELAQWRAVGQMDAFIESSIETDLGFSRSRCLLCRPQVGDALLHMMTRVHLELCHGVNEDDIIAGVHYAPVGSHTHL